MSRSALLAVVMARRGIYTPEAEEAIGQHPYVRNEVSWQREVFASLLHGPERNESAILHGDTAAMAFKERLAKLGFRQSRNRPGKMTDNAYIESFFHSMKSDIYHGVRFAHDAHARLALRDHGPFYNEHRLHSSLRYVPPATFERQARRTGSQ